MMAFFCCSISRGKYTRGGKTFRCQLLYQLVRAVEHLSQQQLSNGIRKFFNFTVFHCSLWWFVRIIEIRGYFFVGCLYKYNVAIGWCVFSRPEDFLQAFCKGFVQWEAQIVERWKQDFNEHLNEDLKIVQMSMLPLLKVLLDRSIQLRHTKMMETMNKPHK